MKSIDYLDVKPTELLPGILKRSVITIDDGAPHCVLRVFDMEPGVTSPTDSHWWEHEVFVLSGRGVVVSEGKETQIKPGTVLFIAPNEDHYFFNNGGETLRFICLVPVLVEP